MSQLALDHVERDAFAGELDGVGVPQLVRSEPAPHAGQRGKAPELDPDPGARPAVRG